MLAATVLALAVPLGSLVATSSGDRASYGPIDVADCVSIGSMVIGMDGPNPEVTLVQARLAELGYDPGEIDGYFGPNTYSA
ncbi:MAG: peptidoglycan-binding domain-containing protein, partial [Desertimonas sp.]